MGEHGLSDQEPRAANVNSSHIDVRPLVTNPAADSVAIPHAKNPIARTAPDLAPSSSPDSGERATGQTSANSPPNAARPPGAEAGRKKKPPRDGFLDTVRTIALLRVIVWHAFGVPWISWFIATMPTMFFIAGSLLASSLDRKPLPELYRGRLKRLLVPYWFFGACVLTFLSVVHLLGPRAETVLRVDQLVPWIVPFTDPTGSTWEGGWAASPLWYLRAYLWLLMLSPLLRLAVRRFGALSLVPMMIATALVELWLHNPNALPIGLGTWTWMLGELTLYGFFLMLGFLHYDGAFESLGRNGRIEWALIGIVGCIIWWDRFPAPTGVINHSFVGLMAIGIFWLAVFLMLRPVLSKATLNSISGPFVYVFNRRAMSVYLWHSPCIAASYWLIEGIAPQAHVTAVLIPTALLLFAAILATGWIEDVSAGKSPELWPRKTGATVWRSPWVNPNGSGSQMWRRHGIGATSGISVALIVAALVVVPTAAPQTADQVATAQDLPPAPSGRPGVADFGASGDGDGGDLPPAPSGRPGVADFGASGDGDGGDLPPAPSGRPGVADFGSDEEAETSSQGEDPATLAYAEGDDLDAVIRAWLEEYDVSGARVAISRPDGTIQSAAVGERRGTAVQVDDVVPVTSATKSLTAAIVLDLVDRGLLDLDEPIPELEAVPSFAHEVTLRQVLDHTAGIAPYQESNGFSSNDELSPATAVALSAATELQWAPGTQRGYSNSGYLVLGLLAEQVTGRSFTDLANERAASLGLATFRMDDTSYDGWVGASAAGMVGTVSELAQWGAALYRDGEVLSADALALMTTLDPEFGVGLGSFPACPCSTESDGTLTYTSIGHNGGEVTVQYSPADDLVIAVSLTESLWTPFLNENDVFALLADIRAVV